MSIPLLNILERSLDASSMRQKAISNNLANSGTPDYQPQRVAFEEQLKMALDQNSSDFVGRRTNTRHIPIGKSVVLPTPTLKTEEIVMNNDGNGVDVDYEMASLSKNSLWYNALAQQINHEFNLLKTVIKGRG